MDRVARFDAQMQSMSSRSLRYAALALLAAVRGCPRELRLLAIHLGLELRRALALAMRFVIAPLATASTTRKQQSERPELTADRSTARHG
jgi:hypothetical protein